MLRLSIDAGGDEGRVIDPKLFAQVPHKNRTAYRDMIGALDLMHTQWIIPAIIAQTGKIPERFPFDADSDPEETLEAIQSQHASEAAALGIAPPPDLATYDLREASDWASWTFLVSQDLTRLRLAVGIA